MSDTHDPSSTKAGSPAADDDDRELTVEPDELLRLGSDAASVAPEALAGQVEDLPARDGAALFAEIPSGHAADVAEVLDPNTAAHILAEMEPTAAASVITDMEPPEASRVLSAMDPDDRVDVLEHVEAKLHDQLVGEMETADAAETRRLEAYPPDTAGGIMTTDVTALDENLSVGQSIEQLRRLSQQNEQLFYVYVVDRRGHLVGVLSMRDLILARPDRRIGDIMIQNVRSVPAPMDQEEVARLFQQTGFLAMPVVDEQYRLLGIITVDDVVDVLEEEATEDVQKLFGAGAEERLLSPWTLSFRKRVGWLLVNLATAFLAAWVVTLFDATIQQFVVLAAFMPIVAGMGGNASAQAMAVTIRGLAVGKIDRSALSRVLYRETIVGVLTGIVCGVVTALIALLWYQQPMLGLVVCLALIINHTLACVSGAAIPFVMKRLGFDPAQSATIFATTVTDIVGFAALLGLAFMIMGRMG